VLYVLRHSSTLAYLSEGEDYRFYEQRLVEKFTNHAAETTSKFA
jgi:hypothetical protein